MPDQAPQTTLVSRNRSASGGVNTFSSPLDIKEDQVVDLTNGLASVPGIREVRSGSSIVASGITFGPILAMSEFCPSSFTPELLVVTPGAVYPTAGHMKLWKWDGTGAFSLIGTLTGMTAPTLPVDIVTGLDLSVVAGGPAVARIINRQLLDFDWYYGGGGLTACSGGNAKPSTGMFPLGLVLGRGLAGGRSGVSRGKLFFSDAASFCITGWSTSQAFTMGGGTRQEIVCIKSFRQADAMIFMQDRIEVIAMTGDPYEGAIAAGAWSRVVIDATIGCGSRRSVQTIGEDLFFVDQYGNVRSLARTITDNSQGTKSLPISAPIQTWIDRINPTALETIQAAAYDRYYVVSFPIDDAVVPSHTFFYDIINQAWYGPQIGTWSKVQALAVATLTSATAAGDRNPTLYIGGTETASGVVYRSFSGTSDDGAPIVFQETTKRESFGTLEAKKKPQRVRVYALPAAGATLMIEARKDGGAFGLVGYMSLSGESPQLPLTLDIDLTGSGIVEKVMTLEQNFQNARDLQYRMTCTAALPIRLLGHSTQALLQNVNWQVN